MLWKFTKNMEIIKEQEECWRAEEITNEKLTMDN